MFGYHAAQLPHCCTLRPSINTRELHTPEGFVIKLGFYGAAGEVTGSCYLLANDHARVMIDFGMHQGEKVADEHNRRLPPIDPTRLTAVILTHAHLDHCGRLPMLVQGGFTGPIYSTAASCELTEIILRDSAYLQEADAERANRYRLPGQPEEKPLYTGKEVERVLPLLRTIRYGERVEIPGGMDFTFSDAGHILGSGSVNVRVRDEQRVKTIVFSGDIGVAGAPILRDPVTPVPPPADVLVMESTYGDRDHRSLAETRAEFLAILKAGQSAGSKILIPAFAVGRTQDLIYHMGDFIRRGEISRLNVYVDSPMATETTDLYRRNKDLYDEPAREILHANGSPLNFPGLKFVKTIEESKRLNTAEGCMVVIAASGMATGGRIVHHLRNNLYKQETQVVIVGYQGQGTLGRKLVDGAQRVRIYGEEILVRAKIHTLGGFSAHAGQSGLIKWAAPFRGTNVRTYLTHGENGPRKALQAKLSAAHGLTSALPEYGEVVEL